MILDNKYKTGGNREMDIRHVKSSDYYVLSPLINEWWGGREMAAMFPKLFFSL